MTAISPKPSTSIAARQRLEEELAVANDRLHLAMAAGKTIGWDWDVKTGRDCWFGDLQTILGIPSNFYESHVDDFRRRVHPHDRERVWRAVKDSMESGRLYQAEFRIVRPDDGTRWLSAQGKFYYASDGQPVRMLGIAVDVTERRHAEEALRQRDIELAEAQRLAGVGSWQWEIETDTVIWSDELYRIAGLDPSSPAVNYERHPRLYTPESWERLQRAVSVALSTGTPYEIQLEMIRPDGTTRWLIARGEPLRNSEGRIVRLRGTVQDVTARRLAEQALKESEERLRLAACTGQMYAYEWDRASDIITRSGEFTGILGLENEPDNTTCQQMLTTVHPDDQRKVLAATDACTPANPICRVNYRVLRPDGSMVWLEKHGRAFFDEQGRMQRMIGMVADITEKKIAEEALSSLSRRLIEAQEAERARIARDLHDDIGQRLALLSITLGQANSDSRASGNEVRLEEMRRQLADIAARVRNLSHELHSSALRLLDVEDALQGFCKELSAKQNVKIDFVATDVPGDLSQDISLCLFRVLQEALHNAVKHSGVRRFEVDLRGISASVHLTIRDCGLGFNTDVPMRSQGLGLISMRERLKLVNGELSIQAQPGNGTTIHARVPVVLNNASTRTAAPAR